MIAVIGWCDGFGNDSFIVGIFDDVKTARKICQSSYNNMPTKYAEVTINTDQYFDYFESNAHPLFDNNKKKKKMKKPIDKTPKV